MIVFECMRLGNRLRGWWYRNARLVEWMCGECGTHHYDMLVRNPRRIMHAIRNAHRDCVPACHNEWPAIMAQYNRKGQRLDPWGNVKE